MVRGDLITYDLTDPTGTGGTAGEAFEAGNTFTAGGVTITVTTTPASSYTANATQGGVANSLLDAGESVTLTFTGLSFDLISIDLNLVGDADSTDSALVTVDGNLFELHTGVANFNGTTDVWSPTPIPLVSGDTIVFAADIQIGLQALTLDVEAIPEPSAFLFGGVAFGMTSFAAISRRMRIRKRVPDQATA
jgi:hypothetical protein